MDDPQTRGDERILIRSTGVNIKSRAFDATLTTRRIILSDRERKLVPPREIPLAIIQAVYAGENAIGEAMITLEAVMKDGRQQKLVLTFSREGGRFRGKERDEWTRLIKETVSPAPAGREPESSPVTNAAYTSAPLPRDSFSPTRPAAPVPQPEKRMPTAAPPAPASILGTYCTKCGTKVPEGSGFCNKCGTRIQATGAELPAPVTKSVSPPDHTTTPPPRIPVERRPVSFENAPSGTLQQDSYPLTRDSFPAAAPPEKGFFSRLFAPKNKPPKATKSRLPRPEKPRRSRKKLLIAAGIAIFIIIVIVAAVLILPKHLPSSNLPSSGTNNSAFSVTASPTVTTGVHVIATKTSVVPDQQTVAAETTQVITNETTSITTTVTQTVKTTATTRAVINQAS